MMHLADLRHWNSHYELRHRGVLLGVTGFSDLYGWFAAVRREDGCWEMLPASGSETQARQRVHAVVGAGRWVRREGAGW